MDGLPRMRLLRWRTARACSKQLQYTFDAQEATMRHFKDHAGKFGLLDKNEDVNLTLAWWGNWRGNAV